jgi:hypothetical protein
VDPIVEALARKSPNIEGFKFTQMSKQQLMEGLAFNIQKGRVGVLEGPMRRELESFEYEATRTGVRYAAPEGLHDDCVVALAQAAQRARQYAEVVMAMASVRRVAPEPGPALTIRQAFDRLREDREWGWSSPARWN